MKEPSKLEPFLSLQEKLYPFVYDGTSSIKIHSLKHKNFLLIIIGRSMYVIKPVNILLNKMIIKDIYIVPEQIQNHMQLSEDIIDVGEVY